jgi:hypothetical protein
MWVLSQLGHFLVSKKGQIKYIFNEGRLITSKKIKRSQAKYTILHEIAAHQHAHLVPSAEGSAV